jgi:putative protease
LTPRRFFVNVVDKTRNGGRATPGLFPPRRERTMAEQEIGGVSHYFGKIGVAAIDITQGELRVGDTIHVKGHTSDFTQAVDSMQIEHESVDVARAGESIGIKVIDHAREHDRVFKVAPD